MNLFNNIVFQSVFKIYYTSLLNFLHCKAIIMFECGSRCRRAERGGRQNRIWWLNAFSRWRRLYRYLYIKKKKLAIPGVSFARYTTTELRFFIFNRREKNCIRNPRNNVYLLHTTTAAVFEGISRCYSETWRIYKFHFIFFFFSPRLIILFFFFLYWTPLTLIMPVAIGYHRPFNFVWGGGCWKNGNYEKKSNTKKWTVIIRCLKLPGILTGSLKQNKVKKKTGKKRMKIPSFHVLHHTAKRFG